MNLQKTNTFLLRLLFIFIVHYTIKIGDESFNVFSGFTLRGFVFSLFFVSYWLCIWYIADYFNRKIQRIQESARQDKKSNTILLFSFNVFLVLALPGYAIIYTRSEISDFLEMKPAGGRM